MIALSGADIVLPDGVLNRASLIVDGERLAAIEPRTVDRAPGIDVVPVSGLTIVPGFIDVHVHGVGGIDVLQGAGAVRRVAASLPRYGVTAFCPTSVACRPETLQAFLDEVAEAARVPDPASARVLPAHLESNFVSPEWRGAQPGECLRTFAPQHDLPAGVFTGGEIVDIMTARREAIAIVTLAPERPGGLDLVRWLRERGHVVSLGHSGSTYEQARDAIHAGVTHATHLFNRMPPLMHRAPGAVGAILESRDVAAEVIGDGVHVHPAMVGLAVSAKGADRVMAITDGTAASGLPEGARASLGGRPLVVTNRTAQLEDGTLAGSITTMDRVFRWLVRDVGLSLVAASRLCATTPAERLGLADLGCLSAGRSADFVILSPACEVVQTWIAGRPAAEHRP